MKTNELKVIDLFAGIGGIRRGFAEASSLCSDCVFTSEWDKFAAETYRANYPGEKIFGDITKIAAREIPDHDILLAGFPCQPFSQAGMKKGFSDTRGTLFFEIIRILLDKQPTAFLLENVKQLKGHDKGRTLSIILDHLSNAGYSIFTKVLAARDFGLPQNRERLFIVGFRDNVDFCFPLPTGELTKVGHILEKYPHPKYTISERLWAGHQRRKSEHKAKGNGFGYSLFNCDSQYTNTISARYYKDGSEILIEQRNNRPRKLTPREAARLQGYPESFIIPVSDTQAYRQFGNSVPVNVIRAVATKMIPHVVSLKSQHRLLRNSGSVSVGVASRVS